MKSIIVLLRKATKKPSRGRRFVEWLCYNFGGHDPLPSDWGYAGGGMLDRWCKYCDGIFQTPVLENDIPEDFKNAMQIMEQPPTTIAGSNTNG